MSIEAVIKGESQWHVECADVLDGLRGLPDKSVDLVFGSPPYERARLYLENGQNLGIARGTDEWVAWMVDVFKESLRVCKGLVAYVVEGQTNDFSYTGSPLLLAAELIRNGITIRKPPLFYRSGIPGSGGPDWLRNDYEFVICATNGGKLAWSDNTACGYEPKYKPGGPPSNRLVSGQRVNGGCVAGNGDTPKVFKAGKRPHTKSRADGSDEIQMYGAPDIANPGNVIKCIVGGGNLGSDLSHKNEAPFPQNLSNFFVRSFCPEKGITCDPFSGSGTTAASCLDWDRRFIGFDIRPSQVELTKRRASETLGKTPLLNAV